ncbi:hypothetical protein C7212DRAFT_280663 [Tuber magnatum]|uniref:Uncharacterized protein n=1 Tax=Tuber magnatum TaxID=42249 RepID=A0A317SPE8_9PEZI|nr:hypothetical protein C7212DRAFT_280663 [Tuber magnatum]
MIHTLAKCCFLPETDYTSSVTSGTYHSHRSGKRLRLPDTLSILLVTESRGDAAAISIYRAAPDHVEVWYSKGRPCTEAEKANIMNFVRSAVQATLLSRTATEDLLRIALEMCKRRVFAHIYKARSLLMHLCLGGSYGIIPAASYADRGFRDAAEKKLRRILGEDALPPGMSLEGFLTRWFQEIILEMRAGVPFDIAANVGFYFQTVVRCYALLQLPGIGRAIEVALLERLRKIAEYYTAVLIVHREVQKLSLDGKAYLIRSIREIPPSTPTTYLTPTDPFTCLNRWAHRRGLAPRFPSSASLPALLNQIRVAECTHPEATLIAEIISTHKASPSVLREIGVSKTSCWICQEFSVAACGLYPGICIRLSRVSVGTAESWKFPVDTPVELVLALTGKIERAMGKVLERLGGVNGVKRGVKRKIREVEG